MLCIPPCQAVRRLLHEVVQLGVPSRHPQGTHGRLHRPTRSTHIARCEINSSDMRGRGNSSMATLLWQLFYGILVPSRCHPGAIQWCAIHMPSSAV